MIDQLFSALAPHLCSSCGGIGSILCESCKYDIIQVDMSYCLACGRVASTQSVCRQCHVPYVKSWCVGGYDTGLQRLIKDYKFHNARAAATALADLLDLRIGILPKETIIVAVPTVSAHIRQRGYDHIGLVARRFAKQRNHTYSPLIERIGSEKQRGAGRAQRIRQAKQAFRVRKILDPSVPYLLIDDVVTTGATLKYAALTLQQAGAREIWVAAIARQALD